MPIPSTGRAAWRLCSSFVSRSKCYRALYRWRWPKGFRCPQCDGRARSRFRCGEQVYDQCRA
ncbi:transposase, partial [Xanthomonas axonopodis]|uniref:transposase n=1 Tax=Xanthomonas axonopodis TaxID=53413 RepID=UPI001431F380